MSIKNTTSTLRDALLYSVKKYPLASLFAVVATLASIFQNHNMYSYIVWMGDIAYASIFGFFLFTAIYHWKRNQMILIGGIVLTSVFWFSFRMHEYTSSIMVSRYVISITIALLLLMVFPFIFKRDSNLRFLAWAFSAIFALAGSIIFGLLLSGSLAGALGIATTLFDFRINGRYYTDILILIMGLFSAHYFLFSLDKKTHRLDTDGEFYGHIGKFFIRYILTPTTLIYAILLIVYQLKILFMMELPNGVIVSLSLVLASLSLATYLFRTPFDDRYKKVLLVIALIQMSMLFIAIYMRISQYGWSSSRYFVTMLGLWFVSTFLYLIIRKNARYEVPFALLIIFLFVSQYGWRLSAYEVSNASQVDRMIRSFEKNAKRSNKYPKELRCSLSRSLDYFQNTYNKDHIDEIMPKIIKKYDQSSKLPKDFLKNFSSGKLGFGYIPKWNCKNKNFIPKKMKVKFMSRSQENYLDISTYDRLYLKSYNIIEGSNRDNNKTNMIIIKDDAKVIGEFDVSPLLKKLPIEKGNKYQDVPQEKLTFIAENDTIAIKVYFDYIEVYRDTLLVWGSSGSLLVRNKR